MVTGELLITEQLKTVWDSLLLGYIPDMWLKVSYPSEKPLACYIKDLEIRMEQLQTWVTALEPPEVFWLSGFFYT